MGQEDTVRKHDTDVLQPMSLVVHRVELLLVDTVQHILRAPRSAHRLKVPIHKANCVGEQLARRLNVLGEGGKVMPPGSNVIQLHRERFMQEVDSVDESR